MATRVMRKHRLAECLLVEVIGLPWEDVHAEACRWEHVMSEAGRAAHPRAAATTRRVSPYGNPIPGLDELGDDDDGDASDEVLVGLDKAVGAEPQRLLVRRLGEPIQTDSVVMTALRRSGVRPGETVKARLSDGGVLVGSGMEYAEVDLEAASHIFVVAR